MRQSIRTKFLPATNHRGSRIKAITSSGGATITLSYDHGLNSDENHHLAAKTLLKKLGWKGRWVPGGGPMSSGGNVYTCVDGDAFTIR